MKWYQSVAVKSFIVAFIATHIPLLALVAVVTLRPQWLTPGGVLGAALIATLLATVVVIGTLWRMFRPLRLAADGLAGFMTHGRQVRLSIGSQDEIGRLVQLLVHSLAHLNRSRAPLLHSGGGSIDRRARLAQGQTGSPLPVVALLEVDQWRVLDDSGDLQRMQDVQAALHRRLQDALVEGELMLPWGRGRYLVVMKAPAASVRERLEVACQRFFVASGPTPFTCSAMLEVRSEGAAGWASALQRLDQRLFALRLEGGMGIVG